ncbi:hypothetical protein Tco_0141950 [Tanacetum coccineum]
MSDYEDSTVAYTEVSSLFADFSNIGLLGVNGPPVMPEQAPPLPVYVPYVPEPAYPEFMPPEDESDLEEDPEEDDDEDPEEDPADYPADEGDDGDDKDESSDDDEYDDVDIEEDEEY